jgi:hypothetical protein
MTRICKDCPENGEQPISNFYRSTSKRKKVEDYVRHSYYCKKCAKIRKKNNYIKNREAILDYNKNYYIKNKESMLLYCRNWYKNKKKNLTILLNGK